jgi:hypothetical protein
VFKNKRSGSALLMVLVAISVVGLMSVWLFVFNTLTFQTVRARNQLASANIVAESVVRVMAERLVAAAESSLGHIDSGQIEQLNAGLSSITLPPGFELDLDRTVYSIKWSGEHVPLPGDLDPIVSVSDWPRSAGSPPVLSGALASRAVQVQAAAVVRGERNGARGAVARLLIARIMPYQYAVATDGTLDACVSSGTLYVSGVLRSESDVRADCMGMLYLAGGIHAGGDIVASGQGRARIVWAGAELPIQSVTRQQFLGSPEAMLDQWGGRITLLAASGARLWPTRYQDALVAGSGECVDFDASCSGTSVHSPSLRLQRLTAGAGAEYQVTCGPAYGATDCTQGLGLSIAYTPLPFGAGSAGGAAQPDPLQPDRPWQGLFVDYRREQYCTAAAGGGGTFRTFRCPSNPYGYQIDLAALPPVPGGLLVIRGSPHAVDEPLQEVVLLINGDELAAPLSIVSEIPVYIAGSFNATNSKPAMVDAPLITLLPPSWSTHFSTASAWDSVGAPLQMRASGVTAVHAVLRSAYHPTVGSYYGGVVEHIPSVLGDWSGAGLRVVGAIEGRAVAAGVPGSYSAAFPAYGLAPAGVQTWQPAFREIHHDPALYEPGAQPPGSWSAANVPGTVWGRDSARQSNAAGGHTAIFWLQSPTRLAPSQIR